MCFLVDSGATYTLLPYEDWQAIGLSPKRSMTFTLADGTTIERKVSECHIELPQGDGHTPVILGGTRRQAASGDCHIGNSRFGTQPLQSHFTTDADAACLIGLLLGHQFNFNDRIRFRKSRRLPKSSDCC